MSAYRFAWKLLTLAGCLIITQPAFAASLRVDTLKTEYQVNPIGLDTLKPRLSWVLRSNGKNITQQAYRITAKKADGTTWDTGKVESAQSIHVEYAGPALKAQDRVSWKVQVWDNTGKTAKSKNATFEMAVLSESDWGGAQWVGKPASATETPVLPDPSGMRWIFYPESGDPSKLAPSGKWGFRRSFELKDKRPIQRAHLACAVDAGATVWVNNTLAGKCEGYQPMRALDIQKHLKSGANTLEMLVHNGGQAAGVLSQVIVEYGTSATQFVRVNSDAKWQSVRLPKTAETRADFPKSGWESVRIVAKPGEGDYWRGVRIEPIAKTSIAPPTYLRKEFQLNERPKRARLSATALGIYEIYINGKRVGDEHFAPGWTDYTKRVQYQTYDVSRMLKKGKNVIAATLADGWYAGFVGWARVRNYFGPYPLRLRAKLDAWGKNKTTVTTDTSWRAANGPVTFSDIFKGERYDARQEQRGWNKVGFDDSKWVAVNAGKVDRILSAEPGGQVRVIETMKPKTLTNPKPGVWVFDMGQNMVGWVRMKVRGPAGTTVTIRHAEMLNPDGTIYTENLRNADATDQYTLAGRGLETWEPQFTFHGFRYVELTGYPGKPNLKTLFAKVAHSDIPKTLSFKTDNKLINQLQSNIDWGHRDNFLSLPTDCPQRDERLGWTGDAQVFVKTACINRDVATFFTKWLRDLNDAQVDGGFTDVAPPAPGLRNNVDTPAWGDAGVIVPWKLYECYADTRLLELSFPHMKAWVDRIHGHNPNLLWKNRRGADYGDWLSIKADTDKEVMATAFFAYSTRLLAQTAGVLGDKKAEDKYRKLFNRIVAAFNKAYVDQETGKIRSHTQTLYAIALRFGLLSPALQEKAGQHLIADVQKRGNHLSTGFIGVSHLLPALSQVGRDDLAYKLLHQQTFPSWLYSVTQGATTIWERWDGWTHDKGFQTAKMNSFNHYSFGSVGEWMYGTVTGLRPIEPGWKRIAIAPVPGGEFRKASSAIDTVYGRVSSAWKLSKDGTLTLNVEVPANTTAEVTVPGTPTANGVPKGATAEGDHFVVGSGKWRFVSRVQAPGPITAAN